MLYVSHLTKSRIGNHPALVLNLLNAMATHTHGRVLLPPVRYPADKSHQDFYRRNKASNGYCRRVIHPKLSKVRRQRLWPWIDEMSFDRMRWVFIDAPKMYV